MSIEATKIRVSNTAGQLVAYSQGRENAPVVLMTHSILTSSEAWDAQADFLLERGWRVIRADTRGHGASEPGNAQFGMDDLANDTVAILDAAGVDRAHYVGLSLGGMSGFNLGLHHRERIASLFLCDARADTPEPLVAAWEERIAIVEQSGVDSLTAQTLGRWFNPSFLTKNPLAAAKISRLISATSVEGFVGCARAIQKLNCLSDLHGITTPTTLLVGADDGVLPDAMQDIARRIPGASLRVIEQAGHLPNIDQPELFNAALASHLSRVEPDFNRF